MAQKSMLWAAPTSGDGTAAYTEAETTRLFREIMGGLPSDEGVLKLVENELEVTGSSSPLAVNTGSAFVYGYFYWNTASVNVTVTTPVIGTTGHRVVLQLTDASHIVRIILISSADGVASIPALTQSAGTTWEISLATLTITTGGTITLTDDRSYCHFATMIDEDRLDASVAGDALSGGEGSPLDVNAGTGLEISSDTIRISNSTAGSGLSGGGVSPLAVNVDGSTIEIIGDALRVKDEGITAAKIDNRTRKFVVTPYGLNATDSLPTPPNSDGMECPDGKQCTLAGFFIVPNDFVSGMTVKAIWWALSSGNAYLYHYTDYGAIGESYSQHDVYTNSAAVALTTLQSAVQSHSLTSAAVGDIVGCSVNRNGGHASDTINDSCYFRGWLVEYTADS